MQEKNEEREGVGERGKWRCDNGEFHLSIVSMKEWRGRFRASEMAREEVLLWRKEMQEEQEKGEGGGRERRREDIEDGERVEEKGESERYSLS